MKLSRILNAVYESIATIVTLLVFIFTFCTMLLFFAVINTMIAAMTYIYGDSVIKFILLIGQVSISIWISYRSMSIIRYFFTKFRLCIINIVVGDKFNHKDCAGYVCPLCNSVNLVHKDFKKYTCKSCGKLITLQEAYNES